MLRGIFPKLTKAIAVPCACGWDVNQSPGDGGRKCRTRHKPFHRVFARHFLPGVRNFLPVTLVNFAGSTNHRPSAERVPDQKPTIREVRAFEKCTAKAAGHCRIDGACTSEGDATPIAHQLGKPLVALVQGPLHLEADRRYRGSSVAQKPP
jgi:hypothetical protein